MAGETKNSGVKLMSLTVTDEIRDALRYIADEDFELNCGGNVSRCVRLLVERRAREIGYYDKGVHHG